MAALAVALSAPVSAQAPDVELRTRLVFGSDTVQPGTAVTATLQVSISGDFHVHSNRPLDEYLIPTALTVTPPDGFTLREVSYPEPILLDAQYSEEPLSVFENEFVIRFALEIGGDVAPGAYPIRSSLRYQLCDDTICLAPVTRPMETTLRVGPGGTQIPRAGAPPVESIAPPNDPAAAPPADPAPTTVEARAGCDVMDEIHDFTVLGNAGGYLGREDFLAFIDGAETGRVAQNFLVGRSALAIVLLTILGGIALNLTPCVLPLIPVNIGIIGAGARASSRARGFLLGGMYGLAMAVVYGAIGLTVILTASTFGAINSTVWFNVGIAALFVVLGLAMFDIIQIDLSRYLGNFDMTRASRGGTLALAFGMGAVTALLAGACVAPVVIQVIVYSGDQYARGTSMALWLPFFLGLGMALPWPFAGAGLSLLPNPGPWMVRVKQALGLFILAFAGYYGYLAWGIYGSTRADRDLVAMSSHDGGDDGWTTSICDGLATARAEDKLVLVDMWATWCKNCSAMEKTTFKDQQVLDRLGEYVKVKYQAEELDQPPARDLLARFEGIGLPTFAILRPSDLPEPTD